jgi:predicted nuclease with RNAse H fold
MPEVIGVHLLQTLGLVGSRRHSAVARLDRQGRLTALDLAGGDDDLIGRIGTGPGTLAIDAPLAVPDETGQRDVERVLAWCDVPAFPVSRRRLEQLHGGARGVALAPRLAVPGREVREALPDLVLRQIAWERDHPPGSSPPDLARYRAAWLGLRAPVYRPKGAGRARAAGLVPAWRLLAGVVDLEGWAPDGDGDDWRALDDAARIDAICCAYTALRMADPEAAMSIGTPERGRVAFPADASLRGRVALTLARLRDEGSVRI